MSQPNIPAIRSQFAAAPKPGYLPAPFDDIRFLWDASDRHIKVEYFGEAERLIGAGAIEPNMAAKTKGPKRRLDSAGHHFRREIRVITREPITSVLHITRYLSDPKFAETLPGVPRGLRFKRLDWLDAHSNELHQQIDESGDGFYLHRRTALAGTAANLVSIAGFSEKAFHGKLRQRDGAHYYLGHDEPGNRGESTWVARLMRGYFEIRFDDIREMRAPAPPAAPPPARRPQLRLLVDNAVL